MTTTQLVLILLVLFILWNGHNWLNYQIYRAESSRNGNIMKVILWLLCGYAIYAIYW